MDVVAAKRAAGKAAAELVEDGARVGLGSGTTASWFVRELGTRVREGLHVTGVPTSEVSRLLALEERIPLIEMPPDGLDIAVDGADAVDGRLALIKGGGGAMVREKIVAASAQRFVVVVDAGKVSAALRGRVPVEIVDFAAERTLAVLSACGATFTLRHDAAGGAWRSDNENLIADGVFETISDPEKLAAQLDRIPGVVGHGLFLGMTDLVIVGEEDGSVREMRPPT